MIEAPRPGVPVESDTLASRWHDVGAGLCVAGLLIPEAVAYAGLARLPVVHALTAMMVGLAIYALFGGSRFAIVEPTSSTATLSAAAVMAVTAVECLLELDHRLRDCGRALVLSRVKEPVRELLLRWDPQGLGAADRLFWSVADAVQAQRPA